ncbi:2'-5' RNA ligase family protein [Xanthomonas campestris]|uniref:2'-5' RNA ligase family protein n=1 Tax=Xanthomonas campestris TaxID=339 RepID=UPI003CCFEAC2
MVEGKPLAPERLHVTLHHLGDYAGGLPPSLVARASQAAERVAQQAFEGEFDPVGTFGGKPLAPERLHVTLHHLGDYAGGLPPSLVARASQAAERVAQQAFEVEFDRVGTFGGRRSQLPCVLRGEEQLRGLYDLQGALGRQLAHVGIAGDAQYTPHMTLLYCNQSLPQRRCDPLRWTVTDFALVRSFLGQSRYQIEGRWSLR